jgi:hypothetical protein
MSTYIKLSTLEYPRHIGDIELDSAGMADYAIVQWVERPQINVERERVNISAPIQVDGQWLTNWVVTQIPDLEQATKVRELRKTKLSESDWTQVADSPVDKAVWATYRQALRDITTQSGFPWSVTWPDAP